MLPDDTKSAASLPVMRAISSSSARVVGSSLKTSSPTSASVIASRIALGGTRHRVTAKVDHGTRDLTIRPRSLRAGGLSAVTKYCPPKSKRWFTSPEVGSKV